jgi:hypothetical protein
MTQTSLLFDGKRAAEARDLALEAVERGADEEWKKRARSVVHDCACALATFTTDDVWLLLDIEGGATTQERRALGTIMRQAALAGWCSKANRTIKSVRIACHRRDLAVWQSHLYAGSVAKVG